MAGKIPTIQRVEFIKRSCRGKRTLHLGCTNYPYTEDAIAKGMLLHLQLGEIASELVGFDFDQEGIDILAEKGVRDVHRADLEHLDNVEAGMPFDVIIAGEVIEHLQNPGLFLSGIKRFMHPGTDLIVTTVNAYAAFRFLIYMLRGKGGVNEPVHPDHVAYFSYRTLTKMLNNAGFTVREFFFYDVGTEHRPTLRWIHRVLNDAAVSMFPHLSDGIIAVCRLDGANAREGRSTIE